MAVVGDAYIMVRAITDRVKDDIRDGFKGSDRIGSDAGRQVSDGFSRGFKRGGGSSSGMFKNLARNAEQARARLQNLVRTGYVLGPALAGLASVIGSAVSGLFALGAQAAAAGPALMSLVGILSAVAQAGAVLKVAFSGVGAALSAGLKGAGGGGGGGVDMSKQIEDALDRIEDAEKRLAQVLDQNTKRLENARKQRQRAARAVADARNAETDALNEVTEAEDNHRKAQEATTRAREEAREAIQQLGFALEDAVLSEERAALAFEDAQIALAKVQNLPVDNRQRREAQLAFDEAELNLRKAKDRVNDTQKEKSEADAKGVEGSDQVVSALEREKDANDAITDAKNDAKRASRDLKDAIEAEEEAIANVNAVMEENKARTKEAEEAIEDAKEALEDLKNGAGGAGGGIDAFAQAMAKLSPEAQGFVRDLLALQPAWQEIKFATQDALFGTLRDDLAELTSVWFPKLRDLMPGTAQAVGTVASKLTDVLTKGENVSRLERVWKDNDKNIVDLGGAVANLADSFIILLDNARPLTRELSKWLEKITAGWKNTLEAKDKTGELADIFDYAGGVAKTLGRIFGNLFRAIFNLGKAASGPGSGGETLLNMLEELTEKWEIFTGSAEGQNKLEKYFQDIVPVVSELGGLIGDIFREIFQLSGESAGPTAEFIGSLRTAVETLGGMGPQLAEALPAIGELIENFAQITVDLTSSGAIDKFFEVLVTASEIAGKIVGSEAFKTIYGLAAPIFATASALGLVFSAGKFLFLGLVVGPILKITKAFGIMGKAIGGIPTLFYRVYSGVLKFGAVMGKIFGPMAKLLGPVISILGKVAMAVRAVGLAFLTPPVGLIIGIIALIIGALVLLYNKNETFRNFVIGVWEKIQEIIGAVATWFQETVWPIIQTVIDLIVGYFQNILWPAIQTVWNLILGVIKFVVTFFQKVIWPIIKIVIELIIGYYKILWSVIKVVWEGIKLAINVVVMWFQNVIWPIIKFVIDLIVGYYEFLWGIVKAVWDQIYGVIETFVNFFRDNVWPIIQAVIDDIKEKFEFVRDKVQAVWDKIKEKIDAVVSFITETIWPAIQDFINNFEEKAETLRKKIKEVFDKIQEKIDAVASFIRDTIWPAIETAFNNVKDAAGTVWDKIKEVFDDIRDKIDTVVEKIKGFLSGMWDGLTNGLSTAVSTVKTILNRMIGFVNGAIRGFNLLPGPDIPEIPPIPLARGGVVYPRQGGVIAQIAEAGRPERVEPLDENGLSNRDKAMISYLTGGQGGGTTINVYPSEGMSERELAQKVSRELALQIRRGAL